MSSAPATAHAEATRTVELAVRGMTCATCAARIERRLNKLDGVSATVNFATETASVRAPAGVRVADLLDQVRRAGYEATPLPPRRLTGEPDEQRVRYLWRRLVVALLLGTPMADLSITLVLVPSLRFPGWRWVLLVLMAPVATWCAWPFHRKALAGARHGATSMDTLVSLGVVAASGWSVYTIFYTDPDAHVAGAWGLIFQPAGSIYLDVVAGVTIFVLAGRLFEAKARRAAGDALRALARLGAQEVSVLRPDGTEERRPAGELREGDEFVVRPGETIGTDGVVLTGASAVDTSTMTGESVPVEVGAGQPVTGATIALSGRLVVRATRVGQDTQLAQMVRLVQRAQTGKARVQRQVDRISSIFVPVVVALAVATCVVRLLLGEAPQTAFNAGLTALIIACPCALGLATPTALLAASGRGAQLGIFIKDHHALEAARAIDTVVLDKTGTVTTARMGVAEIWVAPGFDRATLLRLAGAVEHASEHALATAVSRYARAELADLPPVAHFAGLAGLGARGTVDGHEVLVGSARLMAEAGIELAEQVIAVRERWAAQARTGVLVACDGVVAGAFALSDTVKPSAAPAVAALRGLGLRTVLLSGDSSAAAEVVGAEIGVDEVIAEVLPAGKAAMVARLQEQGRVVAMVGDGVNDAPALAQADLGMAVLTGTGVARSAADLILVRDDLTVVPTAVLLARSTLRTIRTNLVWAFGYNLAALPAAAAGLLNPLISSAAMALSSVLVVSNSLRLRNFGHPPGMRGSARITGAGLGEQGQPR